MADYLHGIETEHSGKVPQNVSEVKTAVIGIVGVPAAGFKNEIEAGVPTVLTKQADIEKRFGKTSISGKLPSYLDKMYEQFTDRFPVFIVVPVGVKTVEAASKSLDSGSNEIDLGHTSVSNIVVKSEDKSVTYVKDTDYSENTSTGIVTILRATPAKYFITFDYGASDEGADVFTPAPATITIGKTNVGAVAVTDSTGETTYTEGSDYTVNYETGVITLLRDIATAKKVGCQYVDTVSDSDIKGSGSSTPRTGIYALLAAKTITRYAPKIIVAPGYSQKKTVADALLTVGNRLRARIYIDADSTEITSVDAAIQARGNSEKAFSFHEKRVNLCFPHLKNGNETYPMSIIAAAVRARTDIDPDMGYHYSISSKKIYGFTGLDIAVVYSFSDTSADSQLLNGAGILTVENQDGLAFCGNRNSSFDVNSDNGNTDFESFEVTMSTGDVIEESIEIYTKKHLDLPIGNVWIDAILSDVNDFLGKLKLRGAILGGLAWYEPDENDPTEIMNGHVVFDYDDAPTPPADRITYNRRYNIDYLAQLGR